MDALGEAMHVFGTRGAVQITELDVSIYPWEKERRAKRPDESDAYTPELEQKQAEQYKMFFRVFRDYRKVLTGVTFWNVSATIDSPALNLLSCWHLYPAALPANSLLTL